MAGPHTLYLLRHGETEWNREHRIQGSRNSPLTPLGLHQAVQQAEILEGQVPGWRQFARYCSPLLRAQETARIALAGLTPTTDLRLRELDCGAWEGLTPSERLVRDPALAGACKTDFDVYRNAPGGEGLDSLEDRLRDFLADLAGPSVIVAHKVVLTVMRGLLTGRGPEIWPQMEAPQGVVIKVSGEVEEVLSKAPLASNLQA